MKVIKLPTHPAKIAENEEVRDIETPDGKFYRVCMEFDSAMVAGHYRLHAKAYEMTAAGLFVQAPNGQPSRTKDSIHTIAETALGDTQEIDDAWCRYTGAVDPVKDATLVTVTAKPTVPGTKYGQLVWDSTVNHAWSWEQGFADRTARAKVKDITNITRTSGIRSGAAFRRV